MKGTEIHTLSTGASFFSFCDVKHCTEILTPQHASELRPTQSAARCCQPHTALNVLIYILGKAYPQRFAFALYFRDAQGNAGVIVAI